jgi:hypothetical protein
MTEFYNELERYARIQRETNETLIIIVVSAIAIPTSIFLICLVCGCGFHYKRTHRKKTVETVKLPDKTISSV